MEPILEVLVGKTLEQSMLGFWEREIDVLIRNTTWTLTRDSKDNALNWAGVNFYDGQGMMVRADSGFETLEDMEGATVCTTTGTTTEMNLADAFRLRGVDYFLSLSCTFFVVIFLKCYYFLCSVYFYMFRAGLAHLHLIFVHVSCISSFLTLFCSMISLRAI